MPPTKPTLPISGVWTSGPEEATSPLKRRPPWHLLVGRPGPSRCGSLMTCFPSLPYSWRRLRRQEVPADRGISAALETPIPSLLYLHMMSTCSADLPGLELRSAHYDTISLLLSSLFPALFACRLLLPHFGQHPSRRGPGFQTFWALNVDS